MTYDTPNPSLIFSEYSKNQDMLDIHWPELGILRFKNSRDDPDFYGTIKEWVESRTESCELSNIEIAQIL